VIFNVFRKSDSHSRVLTSEQLERVLRAGSQSATGIHVSPESASKFGTVFSCVRVRAESVGQLPLHFYEQREKEKRKAVEHTLYELLHFAPNEATTAQEFWEWVSASLDLRGNAYVFINVLPSGEIFELLSLDASWVSVKRDQKRDVYYEVRVPGTDVKRYTAVNILHFKSLSFNGLTGASIIEHARETIALGMALEQHGAKFFKNGGSPGGVLKTDQVLDDDTYDALEKSWEESHGGLDNAHRTAILEAGLSWQSVGVPLRDAQYLEGRKFSKTDIAGLFRVPPHLIGDLERATFSNIEQQGLDFVIHGLQPVLRRIEQRIRLQLVKKEERRRFYAKFNVNGLARGDMAARSAYYTSQIQNGAMSPNEIRELEDMNPREGGDIYLTPMNMLINGQQPGSSKPPAKEPEKAGDEP
jgi:HK97 family phage portal protein